MLVWFTSDRQKDVSQMMNLLEKGYNALPEFAQVIVTILIITAVMVGFRMMGLGA